MIKHRFFTLILFLLFSFRISAAYITWTGNNGTDWQNSGNWLGNVVPGSGDTVEVPSTSNNPIMSANVIINDLIIRFGAIVNVNGNDFVINNTLSNEGILSFIGSESNVSIGVMDVDSGTVIYNNPEPNIAYLRLTNFYNLRLLGEFFDLMGNTTVHGTFDLYSRDLYIYTYDFIVNGRTTQTGSLIGHGMVLLQGDAYLENRIEIGYGSVNITGNSIILNDDLLLSTSLGTGDITINSNIDGNQNLIIQAGGTAKLSSTVGAVTPLTSLSIFGNGNIEIAADIVTQNLVEFEDDVILTANTTIKSGTITFRKGINGSAGNLALDAGNINLHGVIGGTAPPADLFVNASSPIAQSAEVTLSGTLKVEQNTTWTTNNQPLSVGHMGIESGAVVNAGGSQVAITGNLEGAGTYSAESSQTSLGGDLSVGNFQAGLSSLTFNGNSNAWAGRYSFHNLTIAKNTAAVTSTGNWTINNTLNLNSGTWTAGNFTHSINDHWNSTNANFIFNEAGSTIQLTSTNPNITTAGFSDEFNHLQITGNATLLSDISLIGNLMIEHPAINSVGRTIQFDGGRQQDLMSVAPLDTLLVKGSGTVVRLQSSLSATTLNIEANNLFNALGRDFTITTLNNEGRFELSGEQASQVIMTMDTDSGTLRYTKAASADGNIHITDFYNLEIDDQGYGNTYRLMNTTVVNGDLIIIRGTLDTQASNLSLAGNLHNQSGSRNAFLPHSNRVILNGGTAEQILTGPLSFYELYCDEPNGKIIRFGNAGDDSNPYPNSIDTVLFEAGGTFHVHGTSETPIELRPYNASTRYWQINADMRTVTIDFNFVEIWYSRAIENEILVLQTVSQHPSYTDCPGWVLVLNIVHSSTRDLSFGNWTTDTKNGKINAIVFETPLELNGDFSDFEIDVEGYSVLDIQMDGGNAKNFAVRLEEKSYLDTGVEPEWRIVRNTSLKDLNELLLVTESPNGSVIAEDEAPPLLAYTLAIAGLDEIFLHFSEPVEGLTGITGSAGSYTDVSGQKTDLIPNREWVFQNSSPLSATDIVSENFTVMGTVTDSKGNPLDNPVHRISDIALGTMNAGIMEPVTVVAQGQNGLEPNVITNFDGSERLPSEDLHFQAHRHSGLTFLPELYWAVDVTSAYQKHGLWLPSHDDDFSGGTQAFTGLVPMPHAAETAPMNPDGGDLFSFDWRPSVHPEILTGKNLEFFFKVATNLYAARCENENAADWYRWVRPWSFLIYNPVKQAGGVSLFKNVINPNRNEQASLYYELQNGGTVTVQVFDLAGDLVTVLHRGYQSPGEYSLFWDGRNQNSAVVSRGIYFIRFVGPKGMDEIRKVMIIK